MNFPSFHRSIQGVDLEVQVHRSSDYCIALSPCLILVLIDKLLVPHLQVVAMTSACVVAVIGGIPCSKGKWTWRRINVSFLTHRTKRCRVREKVLLMHGIGEQISFCFPWHSSWDTFTLLGTLSLVLVSGAFGDVVPSMLHKDEHDVHSVHFQLQVFRFAAKSPRSG